MNAVRAAIAASSWNQRISQPFDRLSSRWESTYRAYTKRDEKGSGELRVRIVTLARPTQKVLGIIRESADLPRRHVEHMAGVFCAIGLSRQP